MDKEYEDFLYKLLNLLENTDNFMKNNKHIIAYHKILGIQQKLDKIEEEKKVLLNNERIRIKGMIQYIKDGRYEDVIKNIKELKKNFYKLYEKIKSENNNNEKV